MGVVSVETRVHLFVLLKVCSFRCKLGHSLGENWEDVSFLNSA